MRGLIILGILIIGLALAGCQIRKTRQQVSNVLFGFCGVLTLMLIAVLFFGVEQ